MDLRSKKGMAPLPGEDADENTALAGAEHPTSSVAHHGRQAKRLRRWRQLGRPVLGMTAVMIAVLAVIALVRFVSDGPGEVPQYAIAIHGGAGTINRNLMSQELIVEYRETLERSTAAGEAILNAGGSAMDAVVLR